MFITLKHNINLSCKSHIITFDIFFLFFTGVFLQLFLLLTSVSLQIIFSISANSNLIFSTFLILLLELIISLDCCIYKTFNFSD